MRPGMSCSVEILVDDIDDATYAPVQSIFRHAGGNVAFVVEDGSGEQGVYDFIRKERRRAMVRQALSQIRRRVNPVTEAELLDITELWAETANGLGDIHLRTMERLARAQDRRWASIRSKVASGGQG